MLSILIYVFKVFIVVILAAFLHAVWNAMVKKGDNKYVSLTAIVLGHVPISIIVIFFTPTISVQGLPYILSQQYFSQDMNGVFCQHIDWKIIQKFTQ